MEEAMIRAAACALALLVLAGLVAFGRPASATIQEDSCLYPDVEYPLPCDEDDE
jgi:hypothetical protein